VLQPAGAERIAAELTRRLPERGFDTRVLCLEDERAAIGRELAGLAKGKKWMFVNLVDET